MFEKDKWARQQLSRMALYEIVLDDVAKELGCSKSYVSTIFNGRYLNDGSRGGEGARGGITRAKVQDAITKLIAQKQEGG